MMLESLSRKEGKDKKYHVELIIKDLLTGKQMHLQNFKIPPRSKVIAFQSSEI